MLMTGPLNILLPCIIIAFACQGTKQDPGVTFAFALLGIAPLAERLGFVTEQLAIHTNDSMGGLLNATFGNATELIVAISALSKGLYKLVQLSLLGSVISNELLVLGMSFGIGGYYYKTMHFGKVPSQINSTMLMLGVMGVLFPTVLTWTNMETQHDELVLSRISSLVMLMTYIAFLYFQVRVSLITFHPS